MVKNSPTPREVFIETTRACNLRCVQCALSQPDYEAGTLKGEALVRILPFLRKYRPFVHLNGHGETLLCKHFFDMYEAVVESGCNVGFQTNGILLTPELSRRLLGHDRRDALSYIRMFIDAAEKKLFEKIRRRASFDIFLSNARFLAEEKARRGL